MSDSERIERLRQKALSLPLTPGVYLMKDKNGTIIYVGKSKAMKNRVSSYFIDVKNHALKTAKMVSLVSDFDYMLTDTNMEALALENRLIKLYKPKFNIKLKDDKNYPYLRLDLSAEFPKLSFTRKRIDDGARYFGPYSGASTALSLLKTAQKAFGLASCSRVFPRDIGKDRPCLYKQIGLCSAPCDGSISSEEYRELNKKAALFLRGNLGEVKKELEEKMLSASDDLNFEAAAKYRDRISVLDACRQRQKVVGSPDEQKDVIALYSDDICSVISVFFVREGSITDNESMVFSAETLTDSQDIISFLCDFYKKREFIPEEILLGFKASIDDADELSEYLIRECGVKHVKVRIPERGNARQLCAMVAENAAEAARRYASSIEKQTGISLRLAQLLGLEILPERIEAYDISNIGSDNVTAGKICIENGKFKKSAYRTYKIKTLDGQNDYASMREAISRRLAHPEDEFPDLILLDGGRGHVSVIRELLYDMDIDIPVFGMVKDEFHKTRALTDDKSEISIAREQDVFIFIYKLQEEVHRFTIGRMTSAKRKSVKRSSLTEIDGIGDAKARALMAHFKNLHAIKNADRDELLTVKGINSSDADKIISHFSSDIK